MLLHSNSVCRTSLPLQDFPVSWGKHPSALTEKSRSKRYTVIVGRQVILLVQNGKVASDSKVTTPHCLHSW